MTAQAGQAREAQRPRRELLVRTALCGALIGLAAAVAGPALAQATRPPPTPPPPPPGLALSGFTAVSSGGGAPAITTDGASADIDLHAPRTVIDWSSFNLASGQHATFNFDARNWIVLNRIQDSNPATISGTVRGIVNGSYGGNIWFSARNGIIFGPGAQIDAGGILATAAAPDLTEFLDASNKSFDFSGETITTDGQIQIQTGATLTGHGGLVALISPNITSDAGSAVNGQGGSNVLYGVAETYTVRLAQAATGDLDLVDFIVPDTSSGSHTSIGLDLQNTTTANSVFVAAVSRTSVASSVINLEGMITAQGATADGGDIILSGGAGIVGKQIGPAVAGAKPTDFFLRDLNASRDIVLNTNGLTLATPWPRPPKTRPPLVLPPIDTNGSSNGNNLGFGGGHSSLGAPVLTAGPETPSALRGSVDERFISVLNAGRDIKLTSSKEIDLGAGTAARDLTVNAASLLANALTAGRTTSLKTGLAGMHLGLLTFSGDTTLVSTGSAEVDAVGFASGPTQTLTVQAGGNAILGDGTGDVGGGVINLTAGANAIVNLGGAAKVNSVTAGGSAILQAGSLTVGTVKAQQILAKGGSVTVSQATSAGDIYVVATNGDASVTNATAGDDVYVQATGGTASLTNATLTGLGADEVGPAFAGNSDAGGNGRVVSVQSTDLDAKLGLGTGAIAGATLVSVKAGQDATVDLPGGLPGSLSVVSGRDATLRAPTINFDAVSAGRDLTLTGTAGDLASTRNLTAARNITVNASGALSLADITANAGSITLTGRTVTAGAMTAGQDLTLKATNGGVQIASYKVGRDLIVQGATLSLGQALSAIGRDLSISATGDFTTGSNLTVGRDATVNASGVVSLADITANAGSITLTGKTVTAGAMTAGQDLTLKATGGGVQIASYKVGRDLTGQGATLNLGQALSAIGRDLSITTPGDFTTASDLAAGRNVSVTAGGAANLKAVSAQGALTLDVQGKATTGALSGTDVHVVATDFDLGGTLTATTAEIESRSGALRVGGSAGDGAPPGGLWFDNAEFGRVHVTKSVSFYAGPTAGSARGDLTVLGLDVNPASVPLVNLLAGGGHNVLVQGAVAPSTPGGAIRIGDAASAAWRPTQILISGSLGAATFAAGNYSDIRDFSDVRLHATDDIILGSQRFIGLIQSTAAADIELGRGRPAGVAATTSEQNHVFISTGRLELSANGKVVSQNTSPNLTQSVGIFLTARSSPTLVIDPPTLVDVFGTFLDSSGHAVSSFAAGGGVDFVIVDSNGNPIAAPVGAAYRFNSCMVGTSQCSAATQLTASLAQNTPTLAPPASSSSASGDPLGDIGASDSGSSGGSSSGGGGSKSGGQRTANNRNAPPQLLAVSPTDPQAALSDPVVTGAGSEEIWRKREAKP